MDSHKLADIQSLIEGIKIKMQVMQDMQAQIKEAVHIIDGKIANLLYNTEEPKNGGTDA
jgi:hypothetical protein